MEKPKVGETYIVECAHCRGTFAYVHRKARPRKFCSPECLHAFHYAIRRDKGMKAGQPVKCVCSVCRNEFTAVYAGRGRRPRRCSPACNAAAARASFRKWASANKDKLSAKRKERWAKEKSERMNQKEVLSAEAAGE